MRYGLDVSAYLIRRTLGVLPDAPATTPTGEASTATTTATPAPEPEAPTALPTGMGLTARVAWLEGQHTTTTANA